MKVHASCLGGRLLGARQGARKLLFERLSYRRAYPVRLDQWNRLSRMIIITHACAVACTVV